MLSLGVPLLLGTILLGASSCRALEPKSQPEERCEAGCKRRAGATCTEANCARGCRFILDRLIEREGDHVLACVARKGGACDDPVWASCAAQVGWLADGGPPGPPPPKDDFDE